MEGDERGGEGRWGVDGTSNAQHKYLVQYICIKIFYFEKI